MKNDANPGELLPAGWFTVTGTPPFRRFLLAAILALVPAASAQTSGGTWSPAPAAVDHLQPALALRAYIQKAGTFPGSGNGVPVAGSGATAYIGEIRWMTTAFRLSPDCPEAIGAVLPISSNDAIFSLLGSNYGGNGNSDFQLPDLRGRLAIGAGLGPGLSSFTLGQRIGMETALLTPAHLPAHGHLVGTTVSGSSGGGAGIPNHQPSLTLHYLINGDALTQAGGNGSAILARDFIYGGNPGIVTLNGLIPGRTYTATFPGVGYDASSSRGATFSGPFDSLAVDENRYGLDQGLLARLTFTATAASHAVRVVPRVAGTTYHLYGLALADHGITRYAGWRLAEFGADAGNAALAGESADGEKDGMENLLEYAFDLDPRSGDGSPLGPPLPVTLAGMTPGRRFTLPYRPAARDLTYVVQRSSNLAGWTEAAQLRLPGPVITASPGILLEPDPGAGLLRITLTDLALFPSPGFWRVVVILDEA